MSSSASVGLAPYVVLSSESRLFSDPKGILFFRSIEDLNLVGNLKIRNRRWRVSGSHVVAESEFGAPGDGFHAIARVRFCGSSFTRK